MAESKFICAECKGSNLHIQAWVDANTNEYKGDIEDGASTLWCDDCKKKVTFTQVEPVTVRYGFSDLVVTDGDVPQKHITIYSENGGLIGEIECYFIERNEKGQKDTSE